MNLHTFTLTPDEAAELEMLLKRESASAAVEIRHTETREYRERIRRRMELLESILAKLQVEHAV